MTTDTENTDSATKYDFVYTFAGAAAWSRLTKRRAETLKQKALESIFQPADKEPPTEGDLQDLAWICLYHKADHPKKPEDINPPTEDYIEWVDALLTALLGDLTIRLKKYAKPTTTDDTTENAV